jgi:hypothetical protein
VSDDTITSIEELARLIVKDASGEDVKLDQRIEALKTLAPIYTAMRRHHEKGDGEEKDDDFNGFRSAIKEADHQTGTSNGNPTKLRSRRRPDA